MYGWDCRIKNFKSQKKKTNQKLKNTQHIRLIIRLSNRLSIKLHVSIHNNISRVKWKRVRKGFLAYVVFTAWCIWRFGNLC